MNGNYCVWCGVWQALLQRVFEEMGRDVQLVLCIIDKEVCIGHTALRTQSESCVCL